MTLAANRLIQSRDSVAEIGLALGYESEKSFSAAFKRVMNCSPRQYGRRQIASEMRCKSASPERDDAQVDRIT
jgi:AraC-like DNA-binding protein